MAFLSGRVDAHRDQDVRRALHRMKDMAERTGAAVLAIRHFTKSVRGRAVHRGGGSVGISGAARSVLMVAPDPDDEDLRVFAVSKTNLAALPESLAYRVIGDELFDCARITWQGASSRTADELAGRQGQQDRSAPKLEAAAGLLLRMLGDGPRLRADLEAAAQEDGISWRTMEAAKATLGIQSGQWREPGQRRAGPSWWWLPGRAPEWAAEATDVRSATPRNTQVYGPDTESKTAGQAGFAASGNDRSATPQRTLRTRPATPAPAVRVCCLKCGMPAEFDPATDYGRNRLRVGHLECAAAWEPAR
jgi:hypothetical protein